MSAIRGSSQFRYLWSPVSFARLPGSRRGRTASYRRFLNPLLWKKSLWSSSKAERIAKSWQVKDIQTPPRRLSPYLMLYRDIHYATRLYQKQPKGNEVKDPPREPGEDQIRDESDQLGNDARGQQSSGSASDQAKSGEGTADEGNGRQKKKDEPPPPPPPHGNKTPWQVFTETLRSEFQASKEWNESTKALASSANQFTENESIKKARAAYTAASDAATSTTSSALRGTGKALGQGAAWTWETPVVKGVRAGVSATGKAIEKGTRPVRETEAYKKAVGEVKEVIDDGSSSKYGGWTEKEERRRRRELREMNEAKAGGKVGRRLEKVEEDPKWVDVLITC